MIREQETLRKNGKAGMRTRWGELGRRLGQAVRCGVGNAEEWKRSLLGAAIAFVLGQFSPGFGAYPLGIAYLSAVTTELLPAFGGFAVAVLVTGNSALTGGWHPAIYLTVGTAVVIARLAARLLGEPAEPLPLREGATVREQICAVGKIGAPGESLGFCTVVAVLAATATGTCVAAAGGFRVWDLFGMILLVLMAPVATVVFAVGNERALRRTVPGEISYALTAFAVLFALGNLSPFGIPLGVAGGLFLIAERAREKNVLKTLIAVLIAGGASVGTPRWILLYPVAALGFLFLWKFSGRIALLVGSTAATAVAAAVGGFQDAVRILPAALLGTGMSELLALRTAMAVRADEEEPGLRQISPDDLILKDRGQAMEERIRDLSDTFSSLSRLFYDLSDRVKRPALLDLRHVCDEVFEKTCDGCAQYEVCWGLEHEGTLDTVGKLTALLYSHGRAEPERLPKLFVARCIHLERILDGANEACARLTGEVLRGGRAEIFALDYETLSRILTEALEADRRTYECDRGLSNRVAEALASAGVPVEGVAAFGGGRRRVLARGSNLLSAETDAATIRQAVETACGIRMTRPEFELAQGGAPVLYMSAQRRFSVKHAERSVSAGEEGGICGDTVSAFGSAEDRFCALICDGMGRGKEAAIASGMAEVFLEKMLTAGNRAATSLKMLNTLMRSGGLTGTECTVTVDLCEMDLFTGNASFLKSGAAPTFVLRDGKAFRLEAESFPLGILGMVDAQVIRFDLLAGDMIVMMSDGVADALGNRLAGTVKALPRDPDRAAELLLEKAAEGESSPDDCSVAVLCVERAEEE